MKFYVLSSACKNLTGSQPCIALIHTYNSKRMGETTASRLVVATVMPTVHRAANADRWCYRASNQPSHLQYAQELQVGEAVSGRVLSYLR